LLGFLRVEERKKDPGLNPLDSARVIQGAKAPCSLRRAIARAKANPRG